MSSSLSKVLSLVKSDNLAALETQEERNKASKELVVILAQMRKTAEYYLAKNVTNAVVALPTYFNDGQRKFIRDVAEVAGLNILKTIEDPIVAGSTVDTQFFLIFTKLNCRRMDLFQSRV